MIIDVNEADREQDGVKDDENEDIEQMIFENIQNGLEGDDSLDDLEIEDNELVQEQLEGPQPYHMKESTSGGGFQYFLGL